MKTISDGIRGRGAVALFLLLTAGLPMLAQTGNGVNLQIRADQITAHMPPTFHGLMTEEINYAFEGGLYAELIRNRTFKDNATNAAHWQVIHDGDAEGSITLDSSEKVNDELNVSLRLDINKV